MSTQKFSSMLRATQITRCSCFVCVILLGGCDQRLANERTPLPSVPSRHGLIGRTFVPMQAGRCIILQHPPTIADVPVSTHEDIVVMDRDSALWPKNTERLLSASDWSTFNCATFALCELYPLTARDWIEPGPEADNFYRSPAEVILESFATLVSQVEIQESVQLEQRHDIVEEDIVCLEESAPSGFRIVHLGRIRNEGGNKCVISKLGTGALVTSSLKSLVDSYPCTRISIYRPGKQTMKLRA